MSSCGAVLTSAPHHHHTASLPTGLEQRAFADGAGDHSDLGLGRGWTASSGSGSGGCGCGAQPEGGPYVGASIGPLGAGSPCASAPQNGQTPGISSTRSQDGQTFTHTSRAL
jgi:hypothetical protein